jgi:hypothetical protein
MLYKWLLTKMKILSKIKVIFILILERKRRFDFDNNFDEYKQK